MNATTQTSRARDLVEWLELAEDGPQFGEIEAKVLAAKCRRRLWDEPRNHDAAVSSTETGGPGTGQVHHIDGGREAGYLRERTKQLLAIAELAGENYVCWN